MKTNKKTEFFNSYLLEKWASDYHNLSIGQGYFNNSNIKLLISQNEKEIKETKKVKSQFGMLHVESANIRTKNIAAKQVKGISNRKLKPYRRLVDNVIFNIESNWNDEHSLEQKFNLYHTELQKINFENDNLTVGELVLYDPIADHTFNKYKWNPYEIHAVAEFLEKYNNKNIATYLSQLTYDEFILLLNNFVKQINALQAFVGGMHYFAQVLKSKTKIINLKTSLGDLFNRLYQHSKEVQAVVEELNERKIPCFQIADIKLFTNLKKYIDASAFCSKLVKEANQYDAILGKMAELYTIVSKNFKKRYSSNIKALLKREKKGYDDMEEKTLIHSTNRFVDYKFVKKYRRSLYTACFKAKEDFKAGIKNDTDENTYVNIVFKKLNSYIGIVCDLIELDKLLDAQYLKDAQEPVYTTNDEPNDNIVAMQFGRNSYLKIRKLNVQILVYKSISVYLHYINWLLFDIRKFFSKTNQNWILKFEEWVNIWANNKDKTIETNKVDFVEYKHYEDDEDSCPIDVIDRPGEIKRLDGKRITISEPITCRINNEIIETVIEENIVTNESYLLEPVTCRVVDETIYEDEIIEVVEETIQTLSYLSEPVTCRIVEDTIYEDEIIEEVVEEVVEVLPEPEQYISTNYIFEEIVVNDPQSRSIAYPIIEEPIKLVAQNEIIEEIIEEEPIQEKPVEEFEEQVIEEVFEEIVEIEPLVYIQEPVQCVAVQQKFVEEVIQEPVQEFQEQVIEEVFEEIIEEEPIVIAEEPIQEKPVEEFEEQVIEEVFEEIVEIEPLVYIQEPVQCVAVQQKFVEEVIQEPVQEFQEQVIEEVFEEIIEEEPIVIAEEPIEIEPDEIEIVESVEIIEDVVNDEPDYMQKEVLTIEEEPVDEDEIIREEIKILEAKETLTEEEKKKLRKLKNHFGRSGMRIEEMIRKTKKDLAKKEKEMKK